MSLDDPALDELLGAYALDALDANETEAIDEYLTRDPAAREEAARLAKAASWIGATEALAPPPSLRDSVLAVARSRRQPSPGSGAELYAVETRRLDALLDTVPADALDTRTFNGLTVRELVTHLAAMESSLAGEIGAPVVPEVTETGVEERTATFIERYAAHDFTDVRRLWRDSVAAVLAWTARTDGSERVAWLGMDLPRDSLLVARSLETWTHADDIRRALARPLEPPTPPGIHRMADLSVRSLPVALELSGRARRDRLARVVLIGAGGGTWVVPMGIGKPASSEPDVTLTADVVEWCLMAADRLTADEFVRSVEGDGALGHDLVAAAPVFSTL
jgi:uncharacterized protein (TIGR03083 family)